MVFTIARVSSAGLCGLTALWLSACQAHALTAGLGKSASIGAGDDAQPGAGGGASAASAAAQPAASDAAQPAASDERDETGRPRCQAEDARDNCPGRVVLVGYPVEEARRRALAFGYTGKIEVVTQSDYDAKCKAGTVCRVDPRRWEIELDGELTLLVNRKIEISAPQ